MLRLCPLKSLVFLLLAAASVAIADPLSDARQLLQNPFPDVQDVQRNLVELNQLAVPTNEQSPQILLLMVKLAAHTERERFVCTATLRLCERYPQTGEAAEAFRFVWQRRDSEKLPDICAAHIIRNRREQLAADPELSEYLLFAFNAFRAADRWELAVEMGEAYRQVTDRKSESPEAVIDLADVYLKAGNTGTAMQTLSDFSRYHTSDSYAVISHYRLGEIYRAVGETDLAEEQFNRTWSRYQKLHRRPGFEVPEVVSAATAALWACIEIDRRELDRMTAFGVVLEEKEVRRAVLHLDESYQEMIRADSGHVLPCLEAAASMHLQFADALLQQGFRRAEAVAYALNEPPHDAALAEYDLALDSYYKYYHAASSTGVSPEPRREAQHAAEKIFEIQLAQGDVCFAWALALRIHKPEQKLGSAGRDAELAYYCDTIFPVLSRGTQYKAAALSFGDDVLFERETGLTREYLDVPLKAPAADLLSLCRESWDKVRSVTTQLSTAFTYSDNPASAPPLTATLEEDWEAAAAVTERTREALMPLYESVSACELTGENGLYWDDVMFGFDFDYAELGKTVHESIGRCLVAGVMDRNDPVQTDLRRQLKRIQRVGIQAEEKALERGYELASQHNPENIYYHSMLARLAIIEPDQYQPLLETYSASRRSP